MVLLHVYENEYTTAGMGYREIKMVYQNMMIDNKMKGN